MCILFVKKYVCSLHIQFNLHRFKTLCLIVFLDLEVFNLLNHPFQLVARRRDKVDSKKAFKCQICDKDCFDLKNHLEGTHKVFSKSIVAVISKIK